MRKILNSKLFLILILLFIFLCWYSIYRKDAEYTTYKCKTKYYSLKGIIDKVNHKSGYMQAHIIGMDKFVSLNIAETIKRQGFPENYTYEVGDSILKEAGSKEFVIKNEKKIAVYMLDCDD